MFSLTSQNKRLLAALLLITAFATSNEAFAGVASYRKALSSTAWILAKNSDGTSSGTGVLIDAKQKLVVTNAHVVGDSRGVVLFFSDIKNDRPIVEKKHYLNNVKKLGIRGQVVAVDKKRDLALVQLDRVPEGAVAVEMAEQSTSPGEDVDSIGNPGTSDALWVYTSGTVRAVYKKQFRTGVGEHEFMVVETQSPINTGDSGGPVVDSKGKLIGIAQAIAKRGNLISYCVDVTEIKAFLSGPWKSAPLPVQEVLAQSGLEYQKHESGHFMVEMPVTEKIKQSVFITKETEYYERADVRKIWSLAAMKSEAPTAEMTMRLLEQSGRTKLGSWTIEQDPKGNYLVIYVVKMDATATGDVLKSTVDYAAKITSAMAKELAIEKSAVTASDQLEGWLAN